MKGISLGIVVAEFNYDLTYLMLQRAISHAKFLGASVSYIFKVPGTFDTPLAVKRLAERKDVDAIAVIGVVIKGETRHDELVANQTSRKIMDLSLEYDKPITLGIIGPGATHEQAAERIEEYATRAVESAIKLVRRYEQLKQVEKSSDTVYIE